MTEIQRADPRLRRRAVVWMVCAAVAGVVLFGLTATGRIALDDAAQAAAAFGAVAGVLCLSLAAVAAYLWRFASRVRQASRFPPPGQRVIRDTPVLRGAAAIRRGRTFQLLAAALLLCAVVIGLLSWRLLVLLKT